MKKFNNWISDRHLRGFAIPKGISFGLAASLLALVSPVKADPGDNGLVAPSGAYTSHPGTVAPYGT